MNEELVAQLSGSTTIIVTSSKVHPTPCCHTSHIPTVVTIAAAGDVTVCVSCMYVVLQTAVSTVMYNNHAGDIT